MKVHLTICTEEHTFSVSLSLSFRPSYHGLINCIYRLVNHTHEECVQALFGNATPFNKIIKFTNGNILCNRFQF